MGHLSLQKCLVFFLLSDFFLPALCLNGFVCLPAVAYSVTVGVEIKVCYVENPELQIFLPLKPGVGQSIAMHASLTARKVSVVLSDNICLPNPFTMFSMFHLFQKM